MAKTSQAAGLHRASLDKLHDLDAALELMYYGWRGMTLEADEYLAIGSLLEVLGISKQALNRPLNLLLERKLVTSKRSPEQHRSKLLRLTAAGQRIEQRASDHERNVMRKAFDRAGSSSTAAWMAVMEAIADHI